MRTRLTFPTIDRRTFAVRTVIWALLGLLVVLGTSLNDTAPAFPTGTSTRTTGTVHAADTLAQAGPAGPTGTLRSHGYDDSFYGWNSAKSDEPGGETIKLLPAWRWRDSTMQSNLDNDGIAIGIDITRILFIGLGGLFFLISSWLWGLLLSLLKWGLTSDLATSHAASFMNRAYSALYDAISTSGIIGIILALAVLYGIRQVVRGSIVKFFSGLLAVMIPLGLLMAFSGGAAAGADGSAATGSPAWIAQEGTELVDVLSGGLVAGFDFAGLDAAGGEASWTAPADCDEYMGSLRVLYNEHSGATTGGVAERSRSTLGVVSHLWQRGFLSAWMTAQYGHEELGKKIVCHQLEQQAGTPVAEQQALAQYTPGYPKPEGHAYVFVARDEFSEVGDYQASMLSWAACEWTGSSWQLSEPFANTDFDEGSLLRRAGDLLAVPGVDGNVALDADACQKRWEEGKVITGLASNDIGAIKGATVGVDDPVAGEKNRDAYELIDSYIGTQSGQRLLGGLLALLTAGIYLYALGAIAVGAIIAQFGLVVTLVLLPVTLVLLAWPSKTGERNKAGQKLLKLTAGFFVARTVLLMVMILLLVSISAMENLVNSGGRGVNSFVSMAIPLVALFLLRSMLKTMNLGNITSIGGAVGLASAGALTAYDGERKGLMERAGDVAQSSRMRRNKRENAKRQLGEAWKNSKEERANNKALQLAKGGAGAAIRSGKGIRAALDTDGKHAQRVANRKALRAESKEKWLGARDEKGNLVNEGRLRRLRSFAGAVSVAQERSGVRAHHALGSDSAEDRGKYWEIDENGELIHGEDGAPIRKRGMLNAAAAAAKIIDSAGAEHADGQRHEAVMRQVRRDLLKGDKDMTAAEVNYAFGEHLIEHGSGREVEQFENYLQRLDFSDEKDRQKLASFGITHSGQARKFDPQDPSHFEHIGKVFKDDRGYGREHVTSSKLGTNLFITPTRGTGVIPKADTMDKTIAEAGNLMHYVDDNVALKRPDESPERYALRMTYLRENAGADMRNWLKECGVDPETVEGREILVECIEGRSDLLKDDKFKYVFDAATIAASEQHADLRMRDEILNVENQQADLDRRKADVARSQESLERRRQELDQLVTKMTRNAAVVSQEGRKVKLGDAAREQLPAVQVELQAVVAQLETAQSSAATHPAGDPVRVEIEKRITELVETKSAAEKRIEVLTSDAAGGVEAAAEIAKVEAEVKDQIKQVETLASQVHGSGREFEAMSILIDTGLDSGERMKAFKANEISGHKFDDAIKDKLAKARKSAEGLTGVELARALVDIKKVAEKVAASADESAHASVAGYASKEAILKSKLDDLQKAFRDSKDPRNLKASFDTAARNHAARGGVPD